MLRAFTHDQFSHNGLSRSFAVFRRALSLTLAVVAGTTAFHGSGCAHRMLTGSTAPVVVATPAGALNTVLHAALWRPFRQQTGEGVRITGWNGDLASVAPKETKKRITWRPWSMALAEDDAALRGCREGLFLKADAADPASCAPQALTQDYALTWDMSRFQGQPDWQDFWDVARHPGKRSLRADPRGTLEVALLSDGVPPDVIYTVLATQAGQDRAFRRLSQLKPYIVWWSAPTEAMRILSSGAALMGLVPTADVLNANTSPSARHFGIQSFLMLRESFDWVIPENAARAQEAEALRTWVTTPEQKDALTLQMPVIPEADMKRNLPRGIPHVPPPLSINGAFWRDHFAQLNTRFHSWLTEH